MADIGRSKKNYGNGKTRTKRSYFYTSLLRMQGVWYHNSFVDEPAWTSKNVEFNRRKNENTPGTASRKRVIFDNKHHSAFERSPKRRLCNTILGTTALSSSQPNAGLRFREELAPEEEEDLPVHAKKIEELKKWLISRMGVRVGSKTLLLTGPCGSGKTTAVKVLCAELGIEVVEYDGNQEYQVSYNGEEIYEKSMQKTFYQFMSSAECSSLEKMSLKQRLLLIKQLPNVFYRDQEILRKTLESCASSSRCIIAFVLSNNESCWELNPFRLFSNAIIDEFQIQQIKFNAVAATQMTRVVKNAACLLGLKMEKRPEDIKRIVSLANGDLRKTLNMMEFFVPGHPSSMNLLSAADAHFDLFHFIGKIMYAKRATTSTDSWARSEDKLIRKARKKTRILPPKEDINELTSSNFISGKFLSNYIFEHEPSFAPSVKTLKSVQSNLCVFDACFSGDLEIYPLLDRYMLEVATRSAIYHNYQDSSTGSDVRKGKGLYQFGKPKFKPIIERRDAKEQLIRDVFPCSNICDMKMLTLPIAEVIFGKLHYTADKNMLENEEMNRKKLERLKSFIFPEPSITDDFD